MMGLITGALLLLATSSCTKDTMYAKKIEGKWKSTSYNCKEYEAGELVDDYSERCVDWYIGFNFKDDGTGQTIYYEGGDSETYQMTWVIMGDKLMIAETYDGDTDNYTYDIVEIKSDSMILSVTDEYTYNNTKCKDITTYNFNKL